MEKKVIYYSDPLNDDFATKINQGYTTPENYSYHRNIIWRFFANLLYYFILLPIVFITMKSKYKIKIFGKKELKKLKSGYFLYANHTCDLDGFIAGMIAFPKKSHILANPVITRYIGLRDIMIAIGATAVPTSAATMKKFIKHQQNIIKRKGVISIYPEAHIWSYYNGVRLFNDSSFKYPIKCNAPIVVATTVYRTPKKEGKKPGISVYISKPFFPLDNTQTELRDKAYNIMLDNINKYKSYEYIKYVYKENKAS